MSSCARWSCPVRFALCLACLPCVCLPAEEPPSVPWLDNNDPFQKVEKCGKDASRLNACTSEHVRIIGGDGTATEKDANDEFDQVMEDLVQGNLQMLEQLW